MAMGVTVQHEIDRSLRKVAACSGSWTTRMRRPAHSIVRGGSTRCMPSRSAWLAERYAFVARSLFPKTPSQRNFEAGEAGEYVGLCDVAGMDHPHAGLRNSATIWSMWVQSIVGIADDADARGPNTRAETALECGPGARSGARSENHAGRGRSRLSGTVGGPWTMLRATDPMRAHRLDSAVMNDMGAHPDSRKEGVERFLEKRGDILFDAREWRSSRAPRFPGGTSVRNPRGRVRAFSGNRLGRSIFASRPRVAPQSRRSRERCGWAATGSPMTQSTFVGRQPIIDRDQHVVAYELLFRSSVTAEVADFDEDPLRGRARHGEHLREPRHGRRARQGARLLQSHRRAAALGVDPRPAGGAGRARSPRERACDGRGRRAMSGTPRGRLPDRPR